MSTTVQSPPPPGGERDTRTLSQYPGYRFGSDGIIESEWEHRVDRSVCPPRGIVVRSGRWHALSGSPDKDGYLRVILRVDGKSNYMRVNRAICMAFHGPPLPKQMAAHVNGKNTDNRASNLSWCFQRENCSHKVIHGTSQTGERNGNHKLTWRMVEEMRNMRSSGKKLRHISDTIGVSLSMASRICRGDAWRAASSGMGA